MKSGRAVAALQQNERFSMAKECVCDACVCARAGLLFASLFTPYSLWHFVALLPVLLDTCTRGTVVLRAAGCAVAVAVVVHSTKKRRKIAPFPRSGPTLGLTS